MKNILYSISISFIALIESFLNAVVLGFIFGVGLWPALFLLSKIFAFKCVGYIGSSLICFVIVFIKSLPKTLPVKQKDDSVNNKQLSKPLDLKNVKK